jgi:hypothetical protein
LHTPGEKKDVHASQKKLLTSNPRPDKHLPALRQIYVFGIRPALASLKQARSRYPPPAGFFIHSSNRSSNVETHRTPRR